jgi:hypothetical protein
MLLVNTSNGGTGLETLKSHEFGDRGLLIRMESDHVLPRRGRTSPRKYFTVLGSPAELLAFLVVLAVDAVWSLRTWRPLHLLQ